MPLDVRELSLAEGPFRLGEWLVEPRLNRLTRGDESVQIELKVMDVLVCLAEHAGELVERQQLIDTVWATEFISESLVSHAVSVLRNVLGDDPKNPTFIETIHRKGYRLLIEPEPVEGLRHAGRRWLRPVFIAMTMAILAIAAGLWMLSERPVLKETDTILLTDFVNRTGDSIFDGTLKQALAVKLEESPFLNVISEKRVLETLQLMDRDADEGLIPDLGHEVCQRLNLKAMITGEIAPLGSHYVITLNTIECRSGDSLARAQAEAPAKEGLLVAMDHATADLRRKLGESLRSIEDYDTPLAIAATPSLEALKSYSIATRLIQRGRRYEAIPHLRRAIEFDPGFAMAYTYVAIYFDNRGERYEAREWITKAFSLRDRATEHRKLMIEAYYYRVGTGELDKAIGAYSLERDLYPRQPPPSGLATVYARLGQIEKALELREEDIQAQPDHIVHHHNLAWSYIVSNRLDEAEQVVAAAFARGFDSPGMRKRLYDLAFLEGDPATQKEQLRWASGRPDEGQILREHALAVASAGKLRECRETIDRSREVAERYELWAAHASMVALIALAEATSGFIDVATADAETAAALARHPLTKAVAAMAFARADAIDKAEMLADELARDWPLDTLIRLVHVPSIRAEIALSIGDPESAIEHLQTNLPCENRWCDVVDIRGRAFLASGSPVEAAAEFERLIDLRGVWPVHPRYATAHLWLGRAQAAAGNIREAIECYETFLDLWQDADPDIPLLLEARAEYQRLVTTP